MSSTKNDVVSDGVVIINEHCSVLYIDPTAIALLKGSLYTPQTKQFPYPLQIGEFKELQIKQKGNHRIVQARALPIPWKNKNARLIWLHDITLQKRAEEVLQQSEERYALAIHGSKDGVWDWNIKKNTIYFCNQWQAIIGHGDDELGNDPNEWFSRIHKDDVHKVQRRINRHIKGNSRFFESEHRLRHKNGRYRWVLVRGTAIRNRKGIAIRVAGSMSDVTNRIEAENQLKKALGDLKFALASEKVLMEELDRKNRELVELSITDGLTGLYNHRFLQERFDFEFKRVRRYGGFLSCLLMDIDHFKRINDTYGHQFGDLVLRQIATILRSRSREVDICGRYGGEEFLIIMNQNAIDALKYATRLHTAIEQHSFMYKKTPVHVTVSIGIAEFRNEIKRKQTLIERADTALYQAKKDGRNLIRVWKEKEYFEDNSIDRYGIKELRTQFLDLSNQMRIAYMDSTNALIKAVDAKDPYARKHSQNVSRYGVQLARYLRLSVADIEVIKYAGLLHDIGKISVKEEILIKKGKLTTREYYIMKQHPVVGANIIKDVKFLEKEVPIILHHHERYDGKGYPYGLKDREIPLGARILSVADAFDAMTSGRTYKKRLSVKNALGELKRGSGSQFAPDIVDAFIKMKTTTKNR